MAFSKNEELTRLIVETLIKVSLSMPETGSAQSEEAEIWNERERARVSVFKSLRIVLAGHPQ